MRILVGRVPRERIESSLQRIRRFELRPECWRADLLRVLLRACVVLGVVVHIPSVLFALREKLIDLVVIDSVSMAAFILVASVPTLTSRTRATVLCGVL